MTKLTKKLTDHIGTINDADWLDLNPVVPIGPRYALKILKNDPI